MCNIEVHPPIAAPAPHLTGAGAVPYTPHPHKDYINAKTTHNSRLYYHRRRGIDRNCAPGKTGKQGKTMEMKRLVVKDVGITGMTYNPNHFISIDDIASLLEFSRLWVLRLARDNDICVYGGMKEFKDGAFLRDDADTILTLAMEPQTEINYENNRDRDDYTMHAPVGIGKSEAS